MKKIKTIGEKMMNLVIEELEKMLKECELEGFGDREFPQQLRKAIMVLKENTFDYRFEKDLQRFEQKN